MSTRARGCAFAVSLSVVALSGCSGGGNEAAAAASSSEQVTVSSGASFYRGNAQDADYIESMRTNGFWPQNNAESLIRLGHAICDAYEAGTSRDDIQGLMQVYGVSGENSVYLDVLATSAYCPEHS